MARTRCSFTCAPPPRGAGSVGLILDLVCHELATLGAPLVLVTIASADAAARYYYEELGFVSIAPGYVAKTLI